MGIILMGNKKYSIIGAEFFSKALITFNWHYLFFVALFTLK